MSGAEAIAPSVNGSTSPRWRRQASTCRSTACDRSSTRSLPSSKTVVILAVFVNIVVTFANTMLRYVMNWDLPWAADVSTLLLSMVTFLGAPAFLRRTTGMAYTALIDQMSGERRHVLRACGLMNVVAICALSLAVYPGFFAAQIKQILPVLEVNMGSVAIWLGVGLVLMIIYTLEKLAGIQRKALGIALALTGVLTGLVLLLRAAYFSGAIDLDPFCGSIDPISFSMPSAFAPPMVAMSSAARAGSAVGS